MFCKAEIENGRVYTGENQQEMRLQAMNLDNTRNAMVGKQQRGCSKEENEEKKVEVVDGGGWTSSNKAGAEKSEITVCTGPKVPKGTWRVGRAVGLLPRFVLQGSPPPHSQSPTSKVSNTNSPAAANEARHYPAALQQQRG